MRKRKSDVAIDFMLTILFTVGFVFIQEKIIPIKYYTNDQLIMHDLVSGVYTGNNEGHLIYIMYILGAVLAGLYRLIPSIQWYDWLMVLTYPVAFALFSIKVCSFISKIWKKIVALGTFLVAFVVTNMYGIVLNEYTLDAAIWSSLGLFYLITAKKCGKWRMILEEVVIVISLLLCLWLRKQVFFMAVPFVALIIVYRLCVSRADDAEATNKGLLFLKSNIISAFRPIKVVFIGLIFSFLIEKIAYSASEWEEYFAFNDARTDIFDYAGVPSFEEHQELYESLQISKSEVDAMWHGFSLIERLDTGAMQSIAGVSKTLNDGKVVSDKRSFLYSIRRELYEAKKQPVGMLVAVLTVAIYVFWGIYIFKRDDKEAVSQKSTFGKVYRLLFPAFLGGYVIAFLALFLFLGRYPYRVSQGIYTMALFIALGFLMREGTRVTATCKRQIWGNVLYIITCCLLLFFSVRAYEANKDLVARTNWEWGRYNSELAMLEKYCANHPNDLFSFDYSISNYQNDLLLNHSFETAPNSITLNYWITKSPVFNERLENAKITNLTETFFVGDNVFYFSRPDVDDSWLCELGRDYGINTSLVEVDRINGPITDIIVYKVSH